MEAMRFLDFLTGFMVCAVAATFVASWGLKKVQQVLKQNRALIEQHQDTIWGLQRALDRADRALLRQSRRAPNGRFVKRGA